MNDIVIETEDDPVPIVRIIAAQFRRSAQHARFQSVARGFRGKFSLASSTDPQAVTIEATGGRFRLTRGVADDAQIVVRLDFNKPDVEPSVERLWRHPLLALQVGKLMETYETSWTDAGKRFWEAATGFPGMPRAIRLHCTDDDRTFDLGEGEPEVTLQGTAKNLIDLLTGTNVFVVLVMEGKIRVAGSMKSLTILSEVTKNMLLGEM